MDILFRSSDGSRIIKIDSNVIAEISSYVQDTFAKPESGGLLIFRENIGTGNIIIELNTVPFENDIQLRHKFKRKDKRHVEFFNKIYEESEGTYGYIGEWHTHAENHPNYSLTDIVNWRKIAKDSCLKNKSFYHVIVGTDTLRIWEYNYSVKRREAIRVY